LFAPVRERTDFVLKGAKMFVSGELNSATSAAEGLKNSVKQPGKPKAAGPALEVKLTDQTMQQRLREQIAGTRTESKAINSAMSIAQKAARSGTLGEKLEGMAKLKKPTAKIVLRKDRILKNGEHPVAGQCEKVHQQKTAVEDDQQYGPEINHVIIISSALFAVK
jgi:hypothetical protein